MNSKFESHLTNILKSFKNNNKFILGLSGGIDSMALLYLLRSFINNNKSFNIKLFPVIIDHNLRSDSEKEAKEVKTISQNLGFKTQIKKINECRPNGNIQNWARKKRRDILFQKCTELSANLILAHHFDDQAETLFMRMTKKSALDGLSGMSEVSVWNGIFILRPLLFCNKNQIKNYIRINQIKYFEDSSNNSFKFERVKTRYFLESIKKNIWPSVSYDLNQLSNLNSNLLKKTELIFNSWAKNNILINEGGAVRVNYESLKIIFDKSYLFSIKIIGKIIQTVGGKEYPPKRKKTLDLIHSIFSPQFKNKTLGNVNIFFCRGYLFFLRENRNLNFDVKIKKNKYCIFDGRFLVLSSTSGKLIKRDNTHTLLTDQKNPFYGYIDRINNTIPYLKTLEGKTIEPYLNIMKQNSILNDNYKNNCFNLYLVDRILI